MNPYVIGGAIIALILAAGGGFKFGADFAKGQAAREEVLIKKAGDASAERAAIIPLPSRASRLPADTREFVDRDDG